MSISSSCNIAIYASITSLFSSLFFTLCFGLFYWRNFNNYSFNWKLSVCGWASFSYFAKYLHSNILAFIFSLHLKRKHVFNLNRECLRKSRDSRFLKVTPFFFFLFKHLLKNTSLQHLNVTGSKWHHFQRFFISEIPVETFMVRKWRFTCKNNVIFTVKRNLIENDIFIQKNRNHLKSLCLSDAFYIVFYSSYTKIRQKGF